jgi:hypothetical protein
VKLKGGRAYHTEGTCLRPHPDSTVIDWFQQAKEHLSHRLIRLNFSYRLTGFDGMDFKTATYSAGISDDLSDTAVLFQDSPYRSSVYRVILYPFQ